MGEKIINSMEKLDETNYTSWRVMTDLYLEKENAEKHVTDDPTGDAASKAAFIKRDKNLKYEISSTISKKYVLDIRRLPTVKALMQHFEDLFNRKSPLRIAEILANINKPLKPNENPEPFIRNFENNFHLLEEQKFREVQNLSAMLLIAVLPEQYNNLITALQSRDMHNLEFTEIKSKICEEYKRQNKINGEEGAAAAFQIQGKPSTTSNSQIICNYCKKKGHKISECRKRQRKHQNPHSNKNAYNVSSDDELKVLNTISDSSKNSWIVDSGASDHYSNNAKCFIDFKPCEGNVFVANGIKEKVLGSGKVIIKQRNKSLTLNNVKYVPKLKCNLISVTKLQQQNLDVNFGSKTTIKCRKSGKSIINCHLKNGVHQIYEALTVQATICVHKWHRILAHRNLSDIRKLDFEIEPCKCSDFCESCAIGKLKRTPFPKQSLSQSKTHEVITSDVWGPNPISSRGGYNYFITLTDESTKYTEVALMKNRSEVPHHVKCFLEKMKTNFGNYPKIFRSDNAKEYISKDIENYLETRGITHHLTVPYSSQQNGLAERKNLTYLDAARTLIADSKLSESFWGEALMATNFILNRVPCKNGKIPFQEFFNKQCNIAMHRFGSTAFFWKPTPTRKSKLSPRGIKGIMVGYAENSKAYRIFDPISQTIIISRDVKFNDDCMNKEETPKPSEYYDVQIFDKSEEKSEANPPENENQLNEASEEDEQIQPSSPQPLRRSTRQTTKRKFLTYRVYEEPQTHNQAMQSPQKEEWHAAMTTEYNSLIKNNTWNLVELPKDRKAIKCKWVFRTKNDENGNIIKYKARLVAKGFSQIPGIDYEETYAPVSRSVTFRTLLCMASLKKMNVVHIDIQSAFLNGTIKEEIYMEQAPLFNDGSKRVYRLIRSIYGLKQSANVWNEAFTTYLQAMGFICQNVDQCLYKAQVKGGVDSETTVFIMIYVDDVIICCQNQETINDVIQKIKDKFEINNLGNISHFLGMKVTRDSDGNFYISQEQFIQKIVQAAKQEDAKTSAFPLDPGYYKANHEDLLPNNHTYQQLIGMLLYLSIHTRPDITAPVAILSQKTQKPSTTDLNEIKRIIRYIKGTADFALKLSNVKLNQTNIEAFSDANYAEDRSDRQSNSGYIIKLGGGIISWKCRKQTSVAMSTAESELYALAETAKEVLWILKLLQSLDLNFPAVIKVDNQSTIRIAEDEKISDRTKHIATRYFFMRRHIKEGIFKIQYEPTETNIADLLTKPLTGQRIKNLIKSFLN